MSKNSKRRRAELVGEMLGKRPTKMPPPPMSFEEFKSTVEGELTPNWELWGVWGAIVVVVGVLAWSYAQYFPHTFQGLHMPW